MFRLALAAAIFGIIIFGLFDVLNTTLQARGEIPTTGHPTVAEGCRIDGCSEELCVGNGQPKQLYYTNCIFQEEYGCFRTARCEVQTDGQCGWTPTTELTACVQRNRHTSLIE
jgi:hypothetical protein